MDLNDLVENLAKIFDSIYERITSFLKSAGWIYGSLIVFIVGYIVWLIISGQLW